MDTSRAPLGERAWQGILDHVVAVGDGAEAHYLEIKSALDFTYKPDLAKVVKFLLGAANRQPTTAGKHFGGHAVLVVGAAKGGATGIPRGTEQHELENKLRPYLGSGARQFEFGRLPVDDNEVLFILAPPPEDGDPIYTCRKDLQVEAGSPKDRDVLEDGAIYVRASASTRKAKSGEIDALVERARGGTKPPIELEIEVLGHVSCLRHIDETLDYLYRQAEDNFLGMMLEEGRSTSTTSFMLPRPLGQPTYSATREELLNNWRNKKAEYVARGREHFLGAALAGAGIAVISHDRQIPKPHLAVTFHNCEVVDHVDVDAADYVEVVEPITPRYTGIIGDMALRSFQPARPDDPVSWAPRGDDVEVTLTPDSFRPNRPWTSDLDDYVILARDVEATFVEVTWALTEEGSDDTTTGEFRVPTTDRGDAAALFNRIFLDND
ncbi:hypothetical protein [Aeromicrobium sp. CTD01-1L150]|uniref:hypothetical protein n=1 Tax=Aeromicrobium sp. CTD01-1L150 TaxID=3341830 RepID=UPI0035C05E8D